MKATLLLLVTIVGALSGCKKDSSGPDKTQLLCAHAWRTTAHTNTEMRDDVPFVQNSYASYNACFRDNTMTFQNDNQVNCNTGTSHCVPGEPAVFNGHWYLTKDEGTLLADNLFPMMGKSYLSSGIEEYELVNPNDTTLKLKTSRSYNQGNVKVTITDEYTFSAL